MTKNEMQVDGTADYKAVLERSEEYFAEQAESRMFSDVESRTEDDFSRCY